MTTTNEENRVLGAGLPSVKDRYQAARRKLQREQRKFTGVRIITSHTVGSDEVIPAGSRAIKDVIAEMESRWYLWHIFTNYNNEVVIQEARLQ